jgi:hypothetical protein
VNFFEQELRKLVGQSNALSDPRYIGRACYGRVSDNIRAKLHFVTMGYADRYEALKISLINNTEGEIDRSLIRFRDLWGIKPSSNPNFRDGISPHAWTYNGESEWYVYQPTPSDYEILADSMDEYLELFSEDMEQGQGQGQAMT